LPSNGRRRHGKFWEWKDWVFLEHWEELEHACNCNFLRAPLLKLCIKSHTIFSSLLPPQCPLVLHNVGVECFLPTPKPTN
jgi:hypothetical protein